MTRVTISYLFQTRNCVVGELGRVPVRRYFLSADVNQTGQVQQLHVQDCALLQLPLATYGSTGTALISILPLPPLNTTDCSLGLRNMKSVLDSHSSDLCKYYFLEV